MYYYFVTCPATASPSARRDEASQTCKQIWKAAIGIDPWRAAIDADRVTQNVTAMTRASNRNPETNCSFRRPWLCQMLLK